MTNTTIAHSLTYMFKDEDWFWKVSVGALSMLGIGLGIGYFFAMGYYVETVRRCARHEPALPEWNMPGTLLRSGLIAGSAMLVYCALVLGCLAAFHQTGILPAFIGIIVTHAIIQPFVVLNFLERGSLRSCFAFRSFASTIRKSGLRAAGIAAAGLGIFTIVVSFGWMALIVGWPFIVFWGMLAAAALTATLAPPVTMSEAALR